MDQIIAAIQKQPFYIGFVIIGVFNFYQGLVCLYKFFNGYGAYSFLDAPPKQKENGAKKTGFDIDILYLIVPPEKTTTLRKITLLIYSLLCFASIGILYLIIK